MNYFFDMGFEEIKKKGYEPFGIPGIIVSSVPMDFDPKWMQRESKFAIKKANPEISNLETIAIFYKAMNNYRSSEKTKITIADFGDLEPKDLLSLEKLYFYIATPLKNRLKE